MTVKSKANMIINVQPLRTREEIEEFRESLIQSSSDQTRQRNLLLFNIGIQTGLRIGDIIKLKVEDVKGKKSFIIYEGKTEKKRTVHLDVILKDIDDYIKTLDASTVWLFPSRKGDNHISTTQAYRILTKAADYIDRDDIGTHSLRKTFGYHYYKQTKDVATLMQIFNHDSQITTKRYIGINDDEIRDNVIFLGRL